MLYCDNMERIMNKVFERMNKSEEPKRKKKKIRKEFKAAAIDFDDGRNHHEPGTGEIDTKSDTAQLNPMLMDDIVAHTLQFLDLATLKIVRRVCSLWKREGGREMIKKSYICLPPDFQNLNIPTDDKKKMKRKQRELSEALNQLLSSLKSFQQVAVHIPKMKNFTKEDTLLFHNFPTLQHKCGEFKCSKTDPVLVYNTLEKLLSLTKLITNDANILPKSSSDPFWTEEKVETFRTKLKSLSEIKLDFILSPQSHASFIANAELVGDLNLVGLKVSHAHSTSSTTLPGFLKFIIGNPHCHKNWKIRELTMNLETSLRKEMYHDFFQALMISSSKNGTNTQFASSLFPDLKHLDLIVCGAYDSAGSKGLTPGENDWHLPVYNLSETVDLDPNYSPLGRLTSLSIDCPADRLWSCLTCALQLPSLKKLAIKTEKKAGYRFDKKTTEWNKVAADAGIGRTLASKSIEEVDFSLCPFFQFSTMKTLLWFPNLKCLKAQLQQNQFILPLGLCPLFEELLKLRSLEKLEFILMRDENQGKAKYWDIILTGKRSNEDKIEKKYVTLRNLQSLKQLTLDSRCEVDHDVSDFFIDEALVHLKSLQSLFIRGHKFKKSGIVKLRNALGPNAAIQLFRE